MMKSIYLLIHIHQSTDVVAAFTDARKAEKAFEIFRNYIIDNYGLLDDGQDNHERKEKWYCSFKNGHILKITEKPIFTDIKLFKKIL